MQLVSLLANGPVQGTFSARTLFRGALLCILPAMAVAQSPQQYAVRVNGNPIVTARPAARVGGEWFVPLDPIVRALGAELTIDPAGQSLRVLRGDGVATSYESATGRILQGSVIAGQVASFREIQLRVGAQNLLFPLSGVVALLGVTAREDPDHDMLEIESLPPSTAPGAGAGPRFQVASLDHRYSFATDGQLWQQSINLGGEALMGSSRLTGNLDLSRVAGGPILGFRQGSLRIGMRSERTIQIGDQGTYVGLDAMSNTVRGLGYEWRWGKFLADVYGGRAASSTSAALGTAGVANYDTNLGGFGLRRKSKNAELSFGGNVFRGPRRSGTTFGAGYSGKYAGNEFRLQGLAGYFSGFSLRPILVSVDTALIPQAVAPPGGVIELEQETLHVQGGAYGFSVADSYTPFKSNSLLFTGIWDRYSRNFLVVREESRFSALSRKSLSAVLRPMRFLSFSGSVKDSTALLGNPDLERGYTYGVNASSPGRIPIQAGYFRSVTTNGGSLGSRFDLSQYTLQVPNWKRYSASATYTEVGFNGVLTQSVNETASVNFVRFGRFGFHDQVQFENSHNYGPDWTLQVGSKGAYFSAGLDRQTAQGQRAIIAPVAAFNIPLPWKQSLRFSYLSMRGSRIIQFEIGGPIIRRRELVSVNSQMAIVVQSSLTGQVYRDVDLDGKFTSGVDRPIAQLKVTLDDDTATTTDSAGYFRFDGLNPGTHRVRAEIATLPASFIFANDDSFVAILPYRANRRDFLAIPTGQIQGTVSLITLDETGTEVAQVFPDARILATGNRDTFSEGDGAFVLGDLPPGQYQLRLDPAVVPPSFVPRPAMQTVQVKPGQTVSGVVLNVVKSVVMRTAPASQPVKRAQAGALLTASPPGGVATREIGTVAGSGANVVMPPAPELRVRPELDLRADAKALSNLLEHSVSVPTAASPARLQSSPPPPRALQLYARGRAFTQKGNYAEAVAVLTRCINIQPDYALAFNARGYALLRIWEYAQSLADFSEAIRLNPAYANAYRNRAAVRKALGDIGGANEDRERMNSLP